jgi:NAD+ diphosphatase
VSALILFKGDQLWIRRREAGAVCLFDADPARFASVEPLDSETSAAVADEPPAPGAELIGLRAFSDLAPAEAAAQAGLARQLMHWRQTHRFCGVCGAPLARHPTERALSCAACGHLAYPRINPVVITLVHRGDQLLLAHKAGGLYPFWSLIAGFVEANESLEETVVREIAEEVGLKVKNIRYASSQPWSYPNNLMLGFTAEYADGEITPDGDEIAEAGWFGRDHLPPIPSRVSIARRLIDAFFAQ